MTSRRNMLRMGAALVGLGVVGTTAGCTNTPGISQGSGGRLDDRWLYEPDAIRDRDHYGFWFVQPSVVAENEDEFEDEVFDQVEATESRYEFTDLDFEDVQTHLRFDVVDVLSASFDREEVVEELEDEDFDDEEEVGDYTIFVHDSESVAVGVGNSSLVVGRRVPQAEVDAEEVVTTAIETRNDEEDRYREESDAFDAMLGSLTGGTIVFGQTQEPIEIADQENTEPIRFGETARGEITSSDPVYKESEVHYDGYAFYADAGTRVSISMSSSNYESIVALENPDGQVVQSEVSSGAGGTATLDLELGQEGIYRIIATRREAGGGYRLTLEGEGTTGFFEEEVARGTSFSVDGDTTERTTTLVFEDEADDGRIEEWIEEDEAVFDDYDDVEARFDGQTAVVTGTIDTDDLTPSDVL